MSLADSFANSSDSGGEAPIVEAALVPAHDGLRAASGLMASFADSDTEMPERSPGEAAVADAPLVPMAEAGASEAVAKRAEGQKRGSATLRRLRREFLEKEAPMSREERARRAAQARWRKRSEAEESSREVAPADSLPAGVLALVPHVPPEACEPGTMVSFSKSFPTDLEALAAMKPVEPKRPNYQVESLLIMHSTQVLSMKAMAEVMRKDEKTVATKSRLLAAVVVLSRRYRMFKTFEDANQKQKDSRQRTVPLMCVQREQYDGVSFKLRVGEGASSDSDQEHQGEKRDVTKDKAAVAAKLLQVTTGFACLWRCGGKCQSIISKGPTTLRPIEADSAPCLVDGLTKECNQPPWMREEFINNVRLVIADDAGQNGMADAYIAYIRQWQALLKFICSVHKEHRVADIQFQSFHNDSRGLLHSTLMNQYSGVWRKIRKCMRLIFKQKLKRVVGGSASAEAKRFREAVLSQFGNPPGAKVTKRAAREQELWLAILRLLDGDWENWEEIMHYCSGPECCKNRRMTLRQIWQFILKKLARPENWGEDRWLGSEVSVKFHGLWLFCHGLYHQAVMMAFEAKPSVSLEDMPSLVDREESDGDDHEPAAAIPLQDEAPADADLQIVEFVLQDVSPESTSFVRQTTYRENTISWLKTDPRPRLWCMEAVHGIQQWSQKERLKSTGARYEEREYKRRIKGEKPKYRICEAYKALGLVHL